MSSTSSSQTPTGQDVVSSLVASYNAKLTKVGPAALLINFAIVIGISVVTLITFSVLRPRNKLIYEPRRKYYTAEKTRAPNIGTGFLAWLGPIIRMKEDEVFERSGLDAVVLLRFMRMCRWIFTVVALLTCAVLIPISVVYNQQRVNSRARNTLSMLTIQNVKGYSLYAYVGLSYVIVIVVCFFVWVNTAAVVRLRHRYLRSEDYQNGLFARSIMITNVDRRSQTDEGLRRLLESLRIPYPTTAVHIGRRTEELPEIIEVHQETVRKLEQVLTKHLRTGKIPDKRPTMRLGGFLGMGGQKVDAIDHLTTRIQRLEARIETVRDQVDARKPQTYGFASFLKVPYAHVVAKTLATRRLAARRSSSRRCRTTSCGTI